MPKQPDPFFIGWEDTPPREPIQRSRRSAWIAVALVSVLAVVVAATQSDFSGKGTWDFTERTFEGLFLAEPYPAVVTKEAVHYLVYEDKRTLSPEEAKPLHLRTVTITGSLIEDPTQPTSMIAVPSVERIEATGGPSADPLATVEWRSVSGIRGEICDSKCALGAMNPGLFKPHRACATVCLQGGIPPVLIVPTAADSSEHYLLVGPDGAPILDVALEYVALPVEMDGAVGQLGDWKILRADTRSIRTLPN